MKKEINVSGPNGTFRGSIIVTFNYTSMLKTVTNPSTHDDVIKQINYHKIETFVGDELLETHPLISDKNEIITYIPNLEINLLNHLKWLSEKEKTKNVEEQLKEQGFN